MLLGRFRFDRPAVGLEVRLGNSEHVLHGVRDRSLGFGLSGQPQNDRHLITDRFLRIACRLSPLRTAPFLDSTFSSPAS